jgi:hypothetical protein
MAFRDCVQNDIHKVFLDLEFFGERYRIEGREICIVVDNDKLKEKQGGQDLAVAESATLFYARSVDLPTRRPAGEVLNVNGRECIVDDWQEDMGMATVVLRQNIVA